MTIHEVIKRIQDLRTVCAKYGILHHTQKLDAIYDYIETQAPIICVAGTRTSGKCAVVNSLAETDLLPSKLFKPHVLYRIVPGTGGCKVRFNSGDEVPIQSIEKIGHFSKKDYDSTVILKAKTGIFNDSKVEVRTGFDLEDNCPLLNCVLSDVVIICIKASSLFSLEEMSFIEGLNKMNHNKVLICITHVNNINPNEIPGIVKFVSSKKLPFPTVYYSDTPIDYVHDAINSVYGVDNIRKVLSQYISEGIDYSERISVAQSMLDTITEVVAQELTEKKDQLEQQKDRKYATYLSKIAKRESMMLGWTDIRFEYERRETKCADYIISELNKAKGKLASRIQASIVSTSSPKDWWERVFPLTLKNEIDSITNNIDNKLQSQLIRDFNWLNHELQQRFHQSAGNDNMQIGETTLDYVLDTNSLSFNNLRSARYISMAGGATLATTLYFIVGPVGAVASASCSILGDRYIHKAIAEQREKLKNAVANVIDDVFGKMSSMIPSRVNGLYEEIARGIAEKEQAWSSANPIEDFTCEEIDAINKLSASIEDLRK